MLLMRNLETVLSFRCGCKVYTAHALYVASEDWIMAQISVLRIFYFGRCCLTGCFCSTCENQSLLLTGQNENSCKENHIIVFNSNCFG